MMTQHRVEIAAERAGPASSLPFGNLPALPKRAIMVLAWNMIKERASNPVRLFRGLRRVLSLLRAGGLSAVAREIHLYEEARKTARGCGRPMRSYQDWIDLYDTLHDFDRWAITARIEALPSKPSFSVIMSLPYCSEGCLSNAIASIRRQLYPRWELCIVEHELMAPQIYHLLQEHLQQDSRIKLISGENFGHIADGLNAAVKSSSGAFVAFLSPHAEVADHALYMVAEELIRHPEADLLYSDEDIINGSGLRSDPYFKPDWNPDLFFSQDFISHFAVYRRDLIEAVGGFRPGYEGSEGYDLALRVVERIVPRHIRHIPFVLYHRRASLCSTSTSQTAESKISTAARKALRAYFQRKGIQAQVTEASDPSCHRVIYPLPSHAPLVSVIIPIKDRIDLLGTCLSGVLEKTDYPRMEIIVVDNRSEEPGTLRYLDEIRQDPRIRILKYDHPYNFSAINNAAVAEAAGEVIGLLNNDIQIISPGWLREMVSHALRPEVGAVGAKLYYPDGSIQHAGVVLGIHGVAEHAFRYWPRDTSGYHGRAQLVQDVSAVTAACLVMRKAVFYEVGGMNESDLPIAFNDIDFCIRIMQLGYRIVWTPYAELYHLEAATRGPDDSPPRRVQFEQEARYIRQRWHHQLFHDPFYNPNLTLCNQDFDLAFPPRVAKPWLLPST